jgi:hypothetical protein
VTRREALAGRELFGGPNVVSIGAMSGGPHGFTVAGTWISPRNRVVAAVWRSSDGSRWARNDTDPALGGRPGETPLGYAVADGAPGLLLVGAAEEPVAGQEDGALWYSPGGSAWVRVAADAPSLTRPGQTVVDAVQPLADGWLAGGGWTSAGHAVPVVWAVRAGPTRQVIATALPTSRSARSSAVTDLAVTATAAVAAGVVDAHPALWWAPLHAGRLGGWQAIAAPPLAAPARYRLGLAAAGQGWLLVAFSGTGDSQVWRARFAAVG